MSTPTSASGWKTTTQEVLAELAGMTTQEALAVLAKFAVLIQERCNAIDELAKANSELATVNNELAKLGLGIATANHKRCNALEESNKVNGVLVRKALETATGADDNAKANMKQSNEVRQDFDALEQDYQTYKQAMGEKFAKQEVAMLAMKQSLDALQLERSVFFILAAAVAAVGVAVVLAKYCLKYGRKV